VLLGKFQPMRIRSFITIIVVSIAASFCNSQEQLEKPNIIIIMADDIGISDIGCYGSEIQTPNLDHLANEGLRFTTFYNMAKCNPTRSSMLTGLYKGGEGATHIAHLTKKAGYYNIMSGKEHFDPWVPEYCQAENVFDNSFHFWANTQYFLPPSGEFEKPFFLGNKKLKADEIEHEESPMHKTDFITDYAIKWLEKAFTKEEPFFLYLPYNAAHYPLQARQKDVEKYRGKYLSGWDVLREKRFKKMNELGVLPANAKLSPPESNLNESRGPFVASYVNYYPWESLSELQKDSLDLEMSVFAAMIDRMDQNIGRVLNKLEENGKLDNTLIMFLIDNGSCPFYTNKIPDVQPGPANSYWCLRTSWANLGNTPYRQYKQCGHEGGSHTPFIAYWPGVIKANTITHQSGHIVDIAPTFLDILNINYPDSIEGHATIPLHGSSLLPIFKGEERNEPEYFISGLDKFRMFRSGDYKIVRMNGGEWELYDIVNDPTELYDLSDKMPEVVNELSGFYNKINESHELIKE